MFNHKEKNGRDKEQLENKRNNEMEVKCPAGKKNAH